MAAAAVVAGLGWPALVGVGYAVVVRSRLKASRAQVGLIAVMAVASLVAQGAWWQLLGSSAVSAMSGTGEPRLAEVSPTPIVNDTSGQVAAATTEASGPQTAQVISVISGDRLQVNWHDQAQTVRLIGVLAPDPGDSKYPPTCFGIEAKKYLEGLVGNGQISLTADENLPDKDGAGQLIRYVAGPDGSIINRQMIDSGMAKESGSEGYGQKVSFIAAQEAAKSARRGWWGTCNVEEDFENGILPTSTPSPTPTPEPTSAPEQNVVQPIAPTTLPTPVSTTTP